MTREDAQMTTILEARTARAVVIGTGKHDEAGGTLHSVPEAVDSARAIAACLTDVSGLAPDCLDLICDPDEPRELARRIRVAAKADSAFLLYYAGHGLLNDKGDLHLATTKSTGRVRYGEALPYDEIKEVLADRARRGRGPTVVILDCCYSAAAELAYAVPDGFAQSAVQGAYVLYASPPEEQAVSPEGSKYTAFSGALIDLLRNGDEGGDAALTLDGIYQVLRRRLHEMDVPEPQRHLQNRTGGLVLAPNLAYRQPDAPPPQPPGEPKLPPGVSPFKDLDFYDIEDHELFFGRDAIVAEILARLAGGVREGGIRLVLGASGSGKSSVLRAGLLHQIGQGGLALLSSARWPQAVLSPGDDPLGTLATWLIRRMAAAETGLSALRARLRADPGYFAEAIASFQAHPGRDGCPVIIVVDQLEQAFSDSVGEADQIAFLRALRAAAAPRDGGLPVALVIAGLRSDFLIAYQGYEQSAMAATRDAFLISPMTHRELRATIESAAGVAGLGLEPGLVEGLLHDVNERMLIGAALVRGRGVLPHLSHALQATWKQRKKVLERQADGTEKTWEVLTLDAYREAGGIGGALSGTAEATYGRLSGEAQKAAASVLVSLVHRIRLGSTAVETGRIVRQEDLAPGVQRSLVAQVVRSFTAERLLTEDEQGIAFAHEAIIASWGRLRNWIAAENAWLDVEREIGEDASRWDDARPSAGGGLVRRRAARAFLLPAARLNAISYAIAQTSHVADDLKDPARSFLTASRRAGRLRAGFRWLLVLLLIALSFASVLSALNAQGERAQADSRAVAEESVQQREVDPAVAAQLATAAYRISPTVQARSALLSTASLPAVTRITDQSGPGGASTLAIAATRHNRLLATAGSGGMVKLWDVAQPRHPVLLARIRAAPGGAPVEAVAFSRSGGLLASGDLTGHVDLWDVRDPRAPRLLSQVDAGDGAGVFAVALSPDGTTLAAGAATDTARLWDVRDPGAPAALGRPLRGFAGPVRTLIFSPDGRLLAACADQDPAIHLFDTADLGHAPAAGRLIRGSAGAITAIAFSPDSHTLASAAEDNDVSLWDVTRPAKISPDGPPLVGHTNAIFAIAFSPDGTTLATGGEDDTVRIWSLASRTTILTLPHPQPVQGIAFLRGTDEIVTGGNDGLLRFWHLADRTLAGPVAQVSSVLSPDGRTLAEGDSAGQLSLWDTADPAQPTLEGQPHQTALHGRRSGINRMAFSRDGRLLAVPCNGGYIELWNIASPRRPFLAGLALTSNGSDVSAVAFADRDRVLASADNGGTLQLWDISSLRHPRPIGRPLMEGNGAILAVATSPGGTILAAGNAFTQLWDVSNPARPRPLGGRLRGHTEPVIDVAFSRHGNLLATAGEDGTVLLWDVTHPRRPTRYGTLTNAGGPVLGVAFGPQGNLAMANGDGTVWLWSVRTSHATLVAQLTGHTQPVYFADFSPDGETLATSGGDSTVILWDTSPQRTETAVCVDIGKPLTPSERSRFMPDNSSRPICR
jgi:WD40 repeat protein